MPMRFTASPARSIRRIGTKPVPKAIAFGGVATFHEGFAANA